MSESDSSPSPFSKGMLSLLLLGGLLFALYALVPWLNKQSDQFFPEKEDKASRAVTKKEETKISQQDPIIVQLKEQWPEGEILEILHFKKSDQNKKLLFDIRVGENERLDLIFLGDEFGRYIANYKGETLKLYPKSTKPAAEGNNGSVD